MKMFYIADPYAIKGDSRTKLELQMIKDLLEFEGKFFAGMVPPEKISRFYKGHMRPVVVITKDFLDVEGSVICKCDGFWSFVDWFNNNELRRC